MASVVGEPVEPELELDLFSLLAAFRGVLGRAKHRPRVLLPPEQVSIESRIEVLLTRLSETEACGFEDLFGDVSGRGDLIVTFLALLEMIRLRLVRIFQSGPFGPIRVYKRARPSDAPHPIMDPGDLHAAHAKAGRRRSRLFLKLPPATASEMTKEDDEEVAGAASATEGERAAFGHDADPEPGLAAGAVQDPNGPRDLADLKDASAGTPVAAAGGGDEVLTVDAVMDATAMAGGASAVNEQLVVVIEAIVFASPEPLTFKAILKLLDGEPKAQVQTAITELKRRYDDRPGGLQFVEVAHGYQIVTRPELREWVRRMFHERTTQKLSVQALETPAVIAYKQPITAAEITEIRGVNTSGVIGTLLERGLVRISGRRQVVGRPFLYSTTREFLDRFGLRDLADLPKVEDMAGALGFEVPAGIAGEAPQALPADQLATDEDAAVIAGEAMDEDTGGSA